MRIEYLKWFEVREYIWLMWWCECNCNLLIEWIMNLKWSGWAKNWILWNYCEWLLKCIYAWLAVLLRGIFIWIMMTELMNWFDGLMD